MAWGTLSASGDVCSPITIFFASHHFINLLLIVVTSSNSVSFPNGTSATYKFSSSPGDVMTDGPLKTLNRFEAEAPVELELHDSIAPSMLTQAEAHVIFKL